MKGIEIKVEHILIDKKHRKLNPALFFKSKLRYRIMKFTI